LATVFEAGILWSLPAEVSIDPHTHWEGKPIGGLFRGYCGSARAGAASGAVNGSMGFEASFPTTSAA